MKTSNVGGLTVGKPGYDPTEQFINRSLMFSRGSYILQLKMVQKIL